MFGSTTAFGQSSSSPFGSQAVFGQTSNANNNPFAPKPFGSTTPFGSQTGSSIFGGTSTGMFGAPQTSSPFSSTAFGASSSTAFGASSSTAFGASTPSFGASSTSAFGSSSPSFGGGSTVFGQKPAFGGFGAATQTNPFGSTSQPSQPAFSSNLFGSTTPFGTSTQSAFSASSAFPSSTMSAFSSGSAPAFGANSTLGFGTGNAPSFSAPSAPAFGSTPSPGFGTGSGFGVSSTPVFGSAGSFGTSTTSGFGVTSSTFGSSSTPGFMTSSAPSPFGTSTTPAFGTSSAPSFSFASSGFGQSTSAFQSSPFGNNPSPFSAPSSPFGSQATTPTFGNTPFGQSSFSGNRGGSRVVAYSPTPDPDSTGGTPTKLESISAMPVYKDKSHEELRWEDYQLGDKGGSLQPGQSSGGINFSVSIAQSSPFASSTTFGQSSASPFSSSTSPSPFPKPFGPTISTPFGPSPSSSPFQTTSTSSTTFPGSTAPSLFGTSSSSTFNSTPSLFSTSTGQTNLSPFGSFANTQPSLSFQTTPPFQTGSGFGQATSSFAPSSNPSFTQSSIFNTPSTGFAFSNTPSLASSANQGVFGQTTLPQSLPFQLSQTSQPTGGLNFSNLGPPQSAAATGFTGSSNIFGQSTFGPLSTSQSSVALQPVPVTNPFGTLPAMPQVSIGRAGTTPSVQYGISSMPVIDKPAPVRISSLLTSRHLSQRRIRLPARKYNPKPDGAKVPFFSDEEETTGTPKADALFIPRDNPRALVIRPTDQWPLRVSAEKTSPLKDASTRVYENGKLSEAVDVPSSSGSGGKDKTMEDGVGKERVHVKPSQKPNGVHEDNSTQKDESYMTLSGHRAGEAAIVYEHGADIEALMPKLRRSDYYTEPRIQELAAKERAEPGFCRHVKDFVVGRHGYGSIKFLGETDVRRLDLESLVQFNNREVIVYTDDSKKPPIGQGLNKPAEVTLLNIKCFDKKTGRQYTEGPKIEKYKEMLKRKAEDQGAEFMSYDPVKGEWKFRVNHFSKYGLGDEDVVWVVHSAGS